MIKRVPNPLGSKLSKKAQIDEGNTKSIRDTDDRPSRDAGDDKAPSDKSDSSSDAGAAAEVSAASGLRDVGLSGIDSATVSGIDRLAGTLDSRIAESMPTSAVSSGAEWSVREDVAQTTGATESGEAAANFGGGASSPALSELMGMGTWGQTAQGSDTTSASVNVHDEQYAALAREYLNETGRYDADDVANMSNEQLHEVMSGEADRALMGYEGPMDNETIRAWFQAENQGMEENAAREFLIEVGYDPAEVAMMDSETLNTYMIAEGEVAMAGGEHGPGVGDGTGGHSGGSISLSDTESGKTQMGEEDSGSGGSSTSSSSESDSGGGSGSDSGSDSDDDDDNDDDNDSGDTTAQTDTGTDSEESEGNSEGDGAAPESSTPNPEHDSYNEADKAAFLATKLGAESRGQDMDAIDGAIGGGLIVGDAEDPGARAAWFASDMSMGERALAAESVGMAKGGGHTDPVDDSAGGTSDVDVTRLPNYGLIDPADSSTPGGTPVDPITGAPSAPPAGGVRSDADTGEGEGEGDDSAIGFAGADLIGSAGSAGLTGMDAGSSLFRGMEDLNANALDVDRVDVDDLDLGT